MQVYSGNSASANKIKFQVIKIVPFQDKKKAHAKQTRQWSAAPHTPFCISETKQSNNLIKVLQHWTNSLSCSLHLESLTLSQHHYNLLAVIKNTSCSRHNHNWINIRNKNLLFDRDFKFSNPRKSIQWLLF